VLLNRVTFMGAQNYEKPYLIMQWFYFIFRFWLKMFELGTHIYICVCVCVCVFAQSRIKSLSPIIRLHKVQGGETIYRSHFVEYFTWVPTNNCPTIVVALSEGGGGRKDQKNCQGIVVIRETQMRPIFCNSIGN
jgi:hypothetical protein